MLVNDENGLINASGHEAQQRPPQLTSKPVAHRLPGLHSHNVDPIFIVDMQQYFDGFCPGPRYMMQLCKMSKTSTKEVTAPNFNPPFTSNRKGSPSLHCRDEKELGCYNVAANLKQHTYTVAMHLQARKILPWTPASNLASPLCSMIRQLELLCHPS